MSTMKERIAGDKGATARSAFGIRLRAARKRAGLSMEELAGRLGGVVTKQAIGKYETGRMMPVAEVLERLGAILGPDLGKEIGLGVGYGPELASAWEKGKAGDVGEEDAERSGVRSDADRWRVDDGNRAHVHMDVHAPLPLHCSPQLPDSFRPENIRFRDGRKLSAKAGSTMRYRMADQLERCLKLESLLGEKATAFENPLGGNATPPSNAEEIETAAVEVRRRWDLGSGPVVNLLGCLEDKGIRVFETSGLERFDGLSGALGSVPFIVVSKDFPADRRRFTAAHELGHVLCGFPDREGAEALCHAFAGAFLLPRAALEKSFGGTVRRKITLGDLTEIKLTYGISIQAIMHRAKDLGLVGARQFRLFREMVRARGWHETEPVEFVGMERATRFMRLVRSAVASGIMGLEQAAEYCGLPAEKIREEIGEMF